MSPLPIFWKDRNRIPVLALSGVLLIGIAILDWRTPRFLSIGYLYLFPVALSARFLPRWMIVALACLCSGLTEAFSYLNPTDGLFRIGFQALALSGLGLLIAEMYHNRRLTAEAELRMRIVVDISPSPIVTIDEQGLIEQANHAAVQLIGARDESLVGTPIAAVLPELYRALHNQNGQEAPASLRCRAHRANGDPLFVEVRFSTYHEGSVSKAAAAISSSSGTPANGSAVATAPQISLTSRQIEVLRLLVQGLANKEIAVRIGLSESTVKNVLQQLFGKVDVRTRSQLVATAIRRYGDLL